MDILGSLVGLALLSPVLMGLALAVKLGDFGPVFYRGVRTGRFGKRFRIFKFRTMVVDAEHRGGTTTGRNDSRITPLGRFLRRHKLDELPQLINVLLGDMSFVGPRPEVAEYTEQYSDEERAILSVRPGITDLSSSRISRSTSGRRLRRPGRIVPPDCAAAEECFTIAVRPHAVVLRRPENIVHDVLGPTQQAVSTTLMETCLLSGTDQPLSRLGLGGCPLGGHGWGPVDDAESLAAVRRALELGVNFFDTADVYGLGHSEEIL